MKNIDLFGLFLTLTKRKIMKSSYNEIGHGEVYIFLINDNLKVIQFA